MTDEIIVKKRKWYKRKLIYILMFFCLIAGGVVYGKMMKPKAPQYETVKVVLGNLTQTVDATGNVEAVNELDLKFAMSGRIAEVKKITGDAVKAGDELAVLEKGEVDAAVAGADAGLKKSEADLNKVLAGATLEYLAGLNAGVAQAKANLEQNKVSSESAIHVAESAVDTAQNNLKMAEGGENSQIVEDTYDDLVTLLQSIHSTLSSALTESDNILGIDNILANDDFESVLSALDSNKKNDATTKYAVAKLAVDAYVAFSGLSPSATHTEIDSATDSVIDALLKVKSLLESVSGMLDKTVPMGNLSVSELSTMKSGIQTERVAVTTKYTSVIDQKQAIVTAKNSYSTYQIAYNKSLKDFADAKNKAVADAAAYQAAMDKAVAAYNDAKKPVREVDAAPYHAAVASAQASLAQAIANREKAIIKAPADGVIGKIGPKVGEYVGVSDSIIKLVSDRFQIRVDIPETDIGKINIGTGAMITFDSFGSDDEFHGYVVGIEKGETIIQDVIYYKVKIEMEEAYYTHRKDDMSKILNGMTANVVFSTGGKAGVLIIPQRAVRINGEKKVRVLENGQIKEVEVRIGLKGDGGMVEVLSGLKEGDEVVVSVTDSK